MFLLKGSKQLISGRTFHYFHITANTQKTRQPESHFLLCFILQPALQHGVVSMHHSGGKKVWNHNIFSPPDLFKTPPAPPVH